MQFLHIHNYTKGLNCGLFALANQLMTIITRPFVSTSKGSTVFYTLLIIPEHHQALKQLKQGLVKVAGLGEKQILMLRLYRGYLI